MRGLLDRLLVAGLLLLGVLCLAGPLLGVEGSGVLLPVVGVLLIVVAYAVGQVRLTPPDAHARTARADGPDGPALVVGLRPTTPRTMVAMGLAGALLFLVAVLGVGLTDGGALFLPLVLLFAVLVPDGVRALRRRPHLALSARAITYHGWSLDSRLAWDDVTGVRLEGGYRPRLLVTGRAGAASWSVSASRLLVPMEMVPAAPEIAVLAIALDEPQRLLRLIDSYRTLSEAARSAALSSP